MYTVLGAGDQRPPDGTHQMVFDEQSPETEQRRANPELPTTRSAPSFFHALYQQDQLPVTRVAARCVASLQVLQTEAVPAAFAGAHQPGKRAARRRFGQEVPQPPGEDRDGTAAIVLEYQQVDVRPGDLGLQA